MNASTSTHELTVRFTCKPGSLSIVLHTVAPAIERVRIEATQALSAAEYDAFTRDFFAPQAWLVDRGGADPADGRTRVVAVTAPNRRTLYINPEGYDYARYVGIAAE